MSQTTRTIRAVLASVVVMTLGYGAMKATAKSDQQIYDNLAPDLKRKVDLARTQEARQAAHKEQLLRAKQADDAVAPVWAAEDKGKSRR